MSHAAEQRVGEHAVEASLTYVVPLSGEKPVTHLSAPGTALPARVGRFATHRVRIENGRPRAEQFKIEREGFVLMRHPTTVSDFYDDAEVQAAYASEVEALVKAATGAARVLVFDHTIRVNDPATRRTRHVREPVGVVHNDYTERSAPQRVRDLLPADEAEALLKNRFAVVQVWRPIREPVHEMPLAICDAQSIAPGDLVETDLEYKDRTGEILQVAFNPAHRWFYFPEMTRDEALVFKCYDSRDDGRARFTAHSAFEDPSRHKPGHFRESIESRTLAFFDPE